VIQVRKIGVCIERVLVPLVLLYRLIRYGYTFRLIRLAQPRYAKVDPRDYERLRKYEWLAQKGRNEFYAVRRVAVGNGRKMAPVYMHHEVIDVPDGMVADHINRNRLDNRRANVRAATRSQNAFNCAKSSRRACSSRYKGLRWHAASGRWQVSIRANGRGFSVGSFADEVEAARAYDVAAKKYHGEFAWLNFPPAVPLPICVLFAGMCAWAVEHVRRGFRRAAAAFSEGLADIRSLCARLRGRIGSLVLAAEAAALLSPPRTSRTGAKRRIAGAFCRCLKGRAVRFCGLSPFRAGGVLARGFSVLLPLAPRPP
jgi:hypothetical protein